MIYEFTERGDLGRSRHGFKGGMSGYREGSGSEYECGYKDGYRAAMREAKRYYEGEPEY